VAQRGGAAVLERSAHAGGSRGDHGDAEGGGARRLTRRRHLAGGVAGGALAWVAACTPGGQPVPAPAGTAAAPVTVRVHARTGSEDEAYQKRLADFNQQNGQNITAVYEGLGDYYNKLVTLIVAGTVGDVVYVHHTNLAYQQYAAASILRSLDDLIARDRFDFSVYFPPTKPAMTFEGHIWGLPIRGQIVWNTLFYNPNATGGAGLPDPETWTHDDMTAAIQRLTRKSGDTTEAWGALPGGWGDFSYTVSLMRRFGGEVMSTDGKQVTINSPACQAALQWYYDGWHRNRTLLTTQRAPGEGTYAPMGDGRTAMMISCQGGFRADLYKAVNGTYPLEFRVMPKGPGNRVGGFLALNDSSIMKSSVHPDQAWEVLKWLANKDSSYALATQATGSNTPNFRKDTYCDERLLADPRFSKKSMGAICTGAELPEPDALVWNLRYDEFNTLLNQRMNDIRDNKAEPTIGWLNALKADLQAIADRPRDTGLGGGR
jgi:ABC-type glycerol-3-phosphate transport system substrate-binding protein